MKVEFELTVKISGDSMFEIADGLTKAASEPLIARILQRGEDLKNQPPAGFNLKIKDETK